MNSSAFMENLRQLFADCDTDNNGSLGRDEFRNLCAKIGLNEEAASETFDRLDVDKNDRITFDEFASGFNQYKQQTTATTNPQQATTEPSTPVTDGARKQKLSPSPVTARARKSASPLGVISLGAGGPNSSLGSGSKFLKGATRAGNGNTGDASSSSLEFSSSVDCGQSTAGRFDFSSGSGNNTTSNNNTNNNTVVYSSDMINNFNDYDQLSTASGQSGQFGSLMSSSTSSLNQVRNMQDLLECVQKLQSENQILTQIFFKDKREREEYISQLGEEFDQQVREVEERANKRAKEELEAEKRRLREMMAAERETLQHHYQTIEKMSKVIKSQNGKLISEESEKDIDKVRSKLEDTYLENRQLKRSLLDTKTDVAMIWKEMEKLKKQYEDKLSSAYEKNIETRSECDHIKQQLNLMKDSNRKLQDASDVITNYITDKVEPVIKNIDDESNYLAATGANSLTNSTQQSNSRRGSILSEYLNGDNESINSSSSGPSRLAEGKKGAKLNNYLNQPKSNNLKKSSSAVSTPRQSFEKDQKLANSATSQSINNRTADSSSQLSLNEESSLSMRPSLKNAIGRRFFIGSRSQSDADNKSQDAKASMEFSDSNSLTQTNSDDPLVEPADGPSKATFNIILVGDSFVGKTSFAARFMEGSFVQGLISNCSIDFKTKMYKVDGVNYTVNLWDTAGQERFRSITASYFRKADGIILMYDVTDKRSYLNVRNWMSTISDTASENVAVLLIGNKIDLRETSKREKCVPAEEGARLAKEYEIVFLETSVKTGTNLVPSMGKLIRLIAKRSHSEDENDDRIRLNDKKKVFNCNPKNC